MLDLLARHGRLDLDVKVTGDLQTGSHHTVEDTGIVLGQALDQALGDRRGIVRYGHAVVPMDEARAAVALDISGRPYALIEGFERLPAGHINGFEYEVAEEFFRALASAARLTLHVDLQAGTNAHHMIEACFKALARALRVAVSIDPEETGVPVDQGDADLMIAIADYGMGNRRSVEKALAHVGAESVITADHDELRAAHAIILPGVGAFPEAMRNLERTGLGEVLIERAAAGVPLLGICLGMQLLFESSTEHEGARRPRHPARARSPRLQSPRLPHIGWNLVTFERDSALTEGLGDAAAFYHVHSFACRPVRRRPTSSARSEYGERFVSVVERGNVMASQFHPEKSSRDGLRMLRNFAQLAAVAVA